MKILKGEEVQNALKIQQKELAEKEIEGKKLYKKISFPEWENFDDEDMLELYQDALYREQYKERTDGMVELSRFLYENINNSNDFWVYTNIAIKRLASWNHLYICEDEIGKEKVVGRRPYTDVCISAIITNEKKVEFVKKIFISKRTQERLMKYYYSPYLRYHSY